MINDLTGDHVFKNLVHFALPFMLSNVLQMLYTMVDMVVVGQFCGSAGLSAVTIASQVVMLMTTLCMGFSNGSQILISQLVGVGDKEGIRRTIGTLFTTVAAISVVMTVIGVTLNGPILSLLSMPEEGWAQATEYLIICSLGIFFTFGYVSVSAILRGMGDSKKPFVFIAIASVTNLLLDLLFVGPLGMGAAGAALATVIGQGVSFIASIVYLYKRRDAFGFDFKLRSFAPDKGKLKVLLRIGLPLAIQNSAINISMLFVNRFVNEFGVAASATFGVGRRVEMIPSMLGFAISTAISGMVGQNMAAGKQQNAKRAVHYGLLLCGGIFAVFAVIYILFPQAIFSLFTSDAEVLEMAQMFITTVLIAFPAFVLMQPCNAFIQGIGNARISLIFAILDGVVARIGLSLLFAFVLDWGLYGLFLGYCLAAYATAIPAAIYYFSGVWKRRKLLVA